MEVINQRMYKIKSLKKESLKYTETLTEYRSITVGVCSIASSIFDREMSY